MKNREIANELKALREAYTKLDVYLQKHAIKPTCETTLFAKAGNFFSKMTMRAILLLYLHDCVET